MSTTIATPDTAGRRALRGSRLIAIGKWLLTAYLTRRMQRAAIIQLHGMSDYELKDIGITRSQIEWAVRGKLEQRRSRAISEGSC